MRERSPDRDYPGNQSRLKAPPTPITPDVVDFSFSAGAALIHVGAVLAMWERSPDRDYPGNQSRLKAPPTPINLDVVDFFIFSGSGHQTMWEWCHPCESGIIHVGAVS